MDKGPFRFLIALVLCLSLLLTACSPHSPAPTPFPTLPSAPPAFVPLPAFLNYVFPQPRDIVEQAVLLENTEWAGINLAEITKPGETLNQGELSEQVEFLIDGEVLDAKIQVVESKNEGVIVGRFPLSLGEHEATIRARRIPSDVLEHSWRFIVVTEETTMPGLPEGFQAVRPVPDSTITMQQYQEESLFPNLYHSFLVRVQGGVCASVWARKIVEPGEFLDVEDMLRKISFVALDSVPPGPDATISGASELMAIGIADQDGNPISEFPGPRQSKCWHIDLAPGRHEVTVRLERVSGPVEFTWWFVITED